MNRMPASIIALTLSLCGLSSFCFAKPKEGTINVFAASSLTDFVEKAGKAFTAKHPEYTLSTNFSSASALAMQIENAPIDVLFLSAHPKWTKYLIDKGIAKKDVILFGNDLVIAAMGRRSDPPFQLSKANTPETFLKGKIAIGDPESVPAGEYAKESFSSLGWYDYVKTKLIPCASVRAALQTLIVGEADRAIVFGTDLAGRTDVSAIATFPDDSHSPIVYTATIISTQGSVPQGLSAFLDFIMGKEGGAIARELGFKLGGESP
jgi:molybdate transport system substrate-binding protein